MKLRIYQVDAFADRVFAGNPAAVCPLDDWLPDSLMQSIAAENNLSETAFFVPAGEGFSIRWFTPQVEVDLCGHATLASAHVLFDHLGHAENEIVFESRSGRLAVTKEGERLVLDFPAQAPAHCDTPRAIIRAFDREPEDTLLAADLVVVFGEASHVRNAEPDIEALRTLDCRGVIITAPGDDCDFVARFFGPKVGIDEDPVTGSAYTQLAPYWAARTGKSTFHARQVSQRGGEVFCELVGERVRIGGTAVSYLEGVIEVPA